MKLKKILISQPKPDNIEKSPYHALATNYNLDITFYKFFEVVGLTASEFRQSRIHLHEYSAIIFSSCQAVDHFFRLAKELREDISDSTKYFCSSQTIANYLQTYVQYRKRKVIAGQQYFADLLDVMAKHRDESTFLFPCSNEKQTDYTKLLDKAKFNYTRAVMYRLVPKDLHQFNLSDFDMVALFSPIGVRALVENFPDVKSSGVSIAALGASTINALNQAGLPITVAAPTKVSPSMVMALENYILGKDLGSVIVPKPSLLRNSKGSHGKSVSSAASVGGSSRKTKPVIADKAKFKQLQEERKAQAAARRACRTTTKDKQDDAPQPPASDGSSPAAQAKETPKASRKPATKSK